MKLSVKGLAVALAVVFGLLLMFLTGIGSLIWPGYGDGVRQAMATIYPGYDGAATVGQVASGTLYGCIDGAVCGAVIAWVYNHAAT